MKKFILEVMLEDGDYFLTVRDKKFVVRKIDRVNHIFHGDVIVQKESLDVLDDDYERQNEQGRELYKKLKGDKE